MVDLPRSTTRPSLSRLIAAALMLVSALPGQAGSITAESVWDRGNAIQRARSQLPSGVTVTRTRCTVVNVRTGNDRYICTVDYSDPATGAAPLSPSATSAPVP